MASDIHYEPPNRRESARRIRPEAPIEDVYESPEPGLAELVEEIRRQHGLPALGGLVLKGRRGNIGVSGRRRNGADDLVKKSDRFHLGSCAKAMTATLIARLVDDGLVSWRSTLVDIFPELGNGMHRAYREVTVEMLTSHLAGLPANFSLELRQRMYREYVERRELLRLVTATPPETPPGRDYVYSNAGYVAAGAVVEQVTGQRWEEAIRERVFSPLKMNETGFGPAGLEHPWGHRDDGTPVPPDWDTWRRNPDSYPPDNPPSMACAGGVHANLADWLRFVNAHLEQPDHFLSKESWRYLQTPKPGRTYTPGGWAVESDGTFVHSGSNTLYFALVRMRPGERAAALTVANQAGENGPAGCVKLSHALL